MSYSISSSPYSLYLELMDQIDGPAIKSQDPLHLPSVRITGVRLSAWLAYLDARDPNSSPHGFCLVKTLLTKLSPPMPLQNDFRNTSRQAIEKAQHLRMLTVLAEDLGSVLSIYTAIHNLLQMLSLFWPLLDPPCTRCT